MADKKDIYKNGFIYTAHKLGGVVGGITIPNASFQYEHKYPVTGPHNFTDGQDVTGQYKLSKEYWGNGYWIPSEFYSGEKDRKSQIVAKILDKVDDTVVCGNCGMNYSDCICNDWIPVYGQSPAPVPEVKDMEAEARFLVEQFYKTSSGYQQERLFSATLSAITHCELMINEYCKYSELRNHKHQDERIDHYTQLIEQIKNL